MSTPQPQKLDERISQTPVSGRHLQPVREQALLEILFSLLSIHYRHHLEDAITSERPYQRASSFESACEIIRRLSGTA